MAPMPVPPVVAHALPTQVETKKQDRQEARRSQESAPATVVVSLPAEAKLYFNNKLTGTDSERREFQSPPLNPGMIYRYSVRAEMVVDGKVQVESKTIEVHAGQKTSVLIPFPTAVANR